VIFWRPPGNRRPTDEELAICRPFVERHIQLLNPEVIVLVGATAMSAVLGINDPISSVRGKFMDFAPQFLARKIKTFVVFHPSYLMRQSAKKKLAWHDMLELEKFLKDK
jgi:DNA polymerase